MSYKYIEEIQRLRRILKEHGICIKCGYMKVICGCDECDVQNAEKK